MPRFRPFGGHRGPRAPKQGESSPQSAASCRIRRFFNRRCDQCKSVDPLPPAGTSSGSALRVVCWRLRTVFSHLFLFVAAPCSLLDVRSPAPEVKRDLRCVWRSLLGNRLWSCESLVRPLRLAAVLSLSLTLSRPVSLAKRDAPETAARDRTPVHRASPYRPFSVAMGWFDKPSAEQLAAKSQLSTEPLRGGKSVVGTVALNRAVSSGPDSAIPFAPHRVAARSTVAECFRAQPEFTFSVPWPNECCGFECCCCTNLPAGREWQAAVHAGAVAPLLQEVEQLVKTTINRAIEQIPEPTEPGAVPKVYLVGLDVKKAVASSRWVIRANAAFEPKGLSVDFFVWVQKGTDGEPDTLRLVLQFYHGPPPSYVAPQAQQMSDAINPMYATPPR